MLACVTLLYIHSAPVHLCVCNAFPTVEQGKVEGRDRVDTFKSLYYKQLP